MQLPPLSRQPASPPDKPPTEAAAALSRAGNLPPGKAMEASVEKSLPMTSEQRDALLKQTREQIEALQRLPSTPATQAKLDQLREQQTLLQSARLYLLTLKLPDRTLLTYTDKPLAPGQSLQLQSGLQGFRLAIVGLSEAPAAPPVTTPQPAAAAPKGLLAALTHLLKTNLANPPTASAAPAKATSNTAPATPSGPATKPPPLSSMDKTEVRQALLESLQNLTPLRQRSTELFQALPLLQQLPDSLRSRLLPANVQQALKSLAEQLRSPVQLSDARLLPMTLKNSGNFLEHKLALQQGQTSDPQVVSRQLTHQDLKGALLHLLQQLRRDSGIVLAPADLQETPAPASNQVRQLLQAYQPPGYQAPAGADGPPQGLLGFLQWLPQRAPHELNHRQLRNQLMMLMQQHTLMGLGKIQLQQAHSLVHQLANSDTTAPTQSWLFEIPVRYGHEVQQLVLHFRQEWLEEDSEEVPRGHEKVKQWVVMLQFALPSVGGLYVQLKVVREQLSASVWTDTDDSREKVRSRLQHLREQLEAEGITVKSLMCLAGTPPDQPTALNTALVDVKL